MVAQGRVRNGVVVLDEGVRLPEGEVVTVFAPSPATGPQPHSLLDIPPVSLGRVLRPPKPTMTCWARCLKVLEGRS